MNIHLQNLANLPYPTSSACLVCNGEHRRTYRASTKRCWMKTKHVKHVYEHVIGRSDGKRWDLKGSGSSGVQTVTDQCVSLSKAKVSLAEQWWYHCYWYFSPALKISSNLIDVYKHKHAEGCKAIRSWGGFSFGIRDSLGSMDGGGYWVNCPGQTTFADWGGD